jgi:hypothetical protein
MLITEEGIVMDVIAEFINALAPIVIRPEDSVTLDSCVQP